MKTLQEAVDALPDTADGIRDYFLAEGIKTPANYVDIVVNCPMSLYLQRETGLHIGGASGLFGEFRAEKYGCYVVGGQKVSLTYAATQFVGNFDHGMYPELRERGKK
jgi:hypothetical protein